MKNEKIIGAMDLLNPAPGQKARMRSDLEASLLMAEEKQKGEEPPKVFTRRYVPPKRVSWSGICAAMLALAVLCGSFLALRDMNRQQTAESSAREPMETYAEPLCQAYYEVLKLYDRAIQDDWTVEQCRDAGLNSAAADMDSLDQLGYALLDLNYDDREELLITGPEKHYMYDVNGIYAIFTLDSEGEAVPVENFPGDGAAVEVLCHDRTIHFPRRPNPNSEEDRAYDFFRLEGQTLVMTDYVSYAPSIDQEKPWFRYYLGSERQRSRRTSITKEEFDSVLAFHEPVAFDYYSLEEVLNPEIRTARSYQTVLDRYVTALGELWNTGKCQAYQVSKIIREEDELAYCLRDINCDGIEELVITNTEGTLMYSAYVQKEGVAEMLPQFQYQEAADGHPFALMEDGTWMETYDSGYNFFHMGNGTDYYLWKDESGGKWLLQEVLELQDIPNDGMIADTIPKVKNRELTEAEAMAFINAYTPAKLEVRKLTEKIPD